MLTFKSRIDIGTPQTAQSHSWQSNHILTSST